MKTTLRLVAAGALALLAMTLVRYRHVDPCKALEREIVRQVERDVRAASDSVQAALARLGEGPRNAAEGVSSAVENVAVGAAQGAAKTKVERMSRRECAVELWHMAREKDGS